MEWPYVPCLNLLAPRTYPGNYPVTMLSTVYVVRIPRSYAIRVFNPLAQSYQNTPLAQCYQRNEQEKKRAYDQQVREIEHGSFSPLVFSATGGMGTVASVVYKRLAAMIATKYAKSYSLTMQWIRCRISFSLLRSAIMCLHGSRSSRHHPDHPDHISGGSIDLACSMGKVPTHD